MNPENDKKWPSGSSLHDIGTRADLATQETDLHLLPMHQPAHCKLCNSGPDLPFSMAFQPILDVRTDRVLAYEALVRGPNGEGASSVLDRTLHNNRYSIDQRCREKAITVSAALGILATRADLHINFYPNAVYQPKQCLMRTLNAARLAGFPLARIVFEITEVEQVRDHGHLRNIMTEYRSYGLRIAIDDFGSGYSGLALLSEFQPDIIKLDRALVRDVHLRPASQVIIRAIVQVCQDLHIGIVAEGVERAVEMQALCDLGIFTMQGYLWAAPAFEALPRWAEATDV